MAPLLSLMYENDWRANDALRKQVEIGKWWRTGELNQIYVEQEFLLDKNLDSTPQTMSVGAQP